MKFFISAVLFVLLFYIINRIIEPRLIRQCLQKILLNSDDSETLPAKLLYVTMGKNRVFTELSLPIPSKDGEEINIGIIAVNRAGVYIICQINGEGLIENPSEQKWKHIFNGNYIEFDNPFRIQEGARNLIEYYAKNSGLGAVKAHSLLVYTNPDLRFTHNLNRSIVSAENLNKKLSAMDKRGKLSHLQVRHMCKILSDINSGTYF